MRDILVETTPERDVRVLFVVVRFPEREKISRSGCKIGISSIEARQKV